MHTRTLFTIAPGLAALVMAGSAQATLVAYDGFSSYVTSPATTTGSNNNSLLGQGPALTGFASSAPWTLVEGSGAATNAVYPRASTAGLTYSTLPTSGGSAEYYRTTAGTYAKNLYRTAATADTGSVQWASFLLNVPANTVADASVGLSWTSGNRVGVSVSTTGVAKFGFSNATGAVLPSFSTSYTLGATHLYVLKIESMTDVGLENQDRITLWVDPNLASLNPANESTLGPGLTGHGMLRDSVGGVTGTFSELRFTVTPSANSNWLDEFRLGSTLYDAVPVPEPTGMVAAGMAGAVLLRRRRR
jgi:hypothetical protein